MQYEHFAARAAQEGWMPRLCNEFHWQMKKDGIAVNYYPTTSKLYISGQTRGSFCPNIDKIFAAIKGLGAFDEVRVDRLSPKEAKRIRTRLYHNYGCTKCFVCKKEMKFDESSLEHRVPLAMGGSNRFDNLTLSHKECNKNRGHQLVTEKKEVKW